MMNSLTKQKCEWPDPARPGRPLYPEKDGWHWLARKNQEFPEVWEWNAGPLGAVAEYGDQSIGAWLESEGDGQPEDMAKWYRYLGPCLTPNEVQNLRDDFASAERERAHQHGRADRNAAEYAREQAKRQALQKRVAELEGALQARTVKWAGIVGTLIAERDQLIGALQIAVERSGDLEPRPAWIDGACDVLNRGFLKVDRAAPKDEPFP